VRCFASELLRSVLTQAGTDSAGHGPSRHVASCDQPPSAAWADASTQQAWQPRGGGGRAHRGHRSHPPWHRRHGWTGALHRTGDATPPGPTPMGAECSAIVRRDRYFARQIGESLHPGEVGFVFRDMLHSVERQVASEIRVTYPIYPPQRSGADNPMTALRGRPRVLIVDGDADMRDLLGQLVRGEGHEATEAGDGEQALAVVGRHAAEVVFLDMGAPFAAQPGRGSHRRTSARRRQRRADTSS
jgi:CheY-like chemotaxis protein